MNNRGQSLIVFVIFIPVLILLIGLVVDTGFLFSEKRKVENVIKEAIEIREDLSLTSIEVKAKSENLINKNIGNDTNIITNVSENYIDIKVVKYIDTVFSAFFGRENYKIEIKYIGKYIDDDFKIEKG